MESHLFDDLEVASEVAERQLEKWDALRRATREREKVKPARAYQFLTIARDKGSLGDEIAQCMAARLGWHVFDKEIVTYIARDSRVRENLVRLLEERSQNIVQDTISRFLSVPDYGYIGNLEYHTSLIKTLACIANHGSAIIMGRGANFALIEINRGLKVRITASPEVRIQRISAALKIPPDEARRRMRADDEERRKYIRQYYRQDFDDVKYYDIVFSTDQASPERVASAIFEYIEHSDASQ